MKNAASCRQLEDTARKNTATRSINHLNDMTHLTDIKSNRCRRVEPADFRRNDANSDISS